MHLSPQPMRIAIIGSGSGTNARALCSHARDSASTYQVCLVISTKGSAGIMGVAEEFDVPACVLEYSETFEQGVLEALLQHRIDVLLLAGLMRHLPMSIVQVMHGHVLNIHPSLLPLHGGKGMYGIHVHRAVLAAGDSVTGATVHVVTEEYDDGRIVAQDQLDIRTGESDVELQERVKALEHSLYPRAVDKFCAELAGRAFFEQNR